MKLRKFTAAFLALMMCTTDVHAQSYSKEPNQLLDSMRTLMQTDDEDFYQIAEENLSSEAYDYLTQDFSVHAGSLTGASTSAISSPDDIVDFARKEIKWYTKYKKDNSDEKNGKYYVNDYNGSSDGTKTVCIDPGHQSKANNGTEPVGPGASEKKTKVTAGATGKYTKKRESVINLAVAKKLSKELTSRGYKVIMTRDSEYVDISNVERAKKANKAKADLTVRIHCDGESSSSYRGFFIIVPSSNNKYLTSSVVSGSLSAAKAMIPAIKSATGEPTSNIKRYAGGISYRDDLSGTNWAEMPTVLVEMGEMSNKSDDKKLSSASFQKSMAVGMANGIDDYLGGSSEKTTKSEKNSSKTTVSHWSALWLAYMCYSKFEVIDKSDAKKASLSDAKKWAAFFKSNPNIGTYSSYKKGDDISKGDLIIWDDHLGIYTEKDKYISGDLDDTIKEKSIKKEKSEIKGIVTLAVGGDAAYLEASDVKGKKVNIPQSFSQTWTASELNGHLIATTLHWYSTNKSTAAKIARLWKRKGSKMSSYIGTIDGAYLCATTGNVGGSDGNILAVELNNGKIIKCIKIDEKSSTDANCTIYGHMTGGKLSVVEFYLGTGNPNKSSSKLSINWKCPFASQKVKSVTIIGKISGY